MAQSFRYPPDMAATLESLRTRPRLVALLIAIVAQLFLTWHIDRPGKIFFDEVHYVPAAKTLLALEGPRNTEHPLVAKELIATGIAVFGDNPFGWRMMSTLAGTATIVAGFAFLWLLLGAMRPAVIGAALLALNQMVYIQARIGMLDVFLGAFMAWALVAMLWAMRAPPEKTRIRWILGSALLGLAVGVKWAAIPYVALAALAFVVLRAGEHWGARKDGGIPSVTAAVLSGRTHKRWNGLNTLEGLFLLGVVSIAVYLFTFLPAFFYAHDPLTLGRLIPFQFEMYNLQTQKLPSHTYQSNWESWPLMLRPIWYFYEKDIDGIQRGVFLIGNPLILWGGLVAVLACYVAAIRERAMKPLAMALLWTASLAIYIVIPKSLGFFYYYYLSAIFISLTIVVAFHHFDRGRNRGWEDWFTAAALLVFIFFFPIISGAPLGDAGAFTTWTLFPSWI